MNRPDLEAIERRAKEWDDWTKIKRSDMGDVWNALEASNDDRMELAAYARELEATRTGCCEVCWTVSWEPTPEGVRCGYCWLKEAQHITVARLEARIANLDSVLSDLLLTPRDVVITRLEALLWEAYECTEPNQPYQSTLPRTLRAKIALALKNDVQNPS